MVSNIFVENRKLIIMSKSNPESIKSAQEVGSAVCGSLMKIAPKVSSSLIDEMEKKQKEGFKSKQ